MNKKTKKRLIIAAVTLILVTLLYKLFASECHMQCSQDSSGRYACMPVCTRTSEQNNPETLGGHNNHDDHGQTTSPDPTQ